MQSARIVYIRHSDGGVDVCRPMKEALRAMSSGGYWDGRPRGFVDEQIRRQVEEGRIYEHVVRFCNAIAFGGCSTAEAFDIIRGRDCGHVGHSFEKIQYDDLPEDRWFRNAWRLNHNGAVRVDIELARPIQIERIENAINLYHQKRIMTAIRKPKAIKVNMANIKRYISKAVSVDRLRAIWPEELTH